MPKRPDLVLEEVEKENGEAAPGNEKSPRLHQNGARVSVGARKAIIRLNVNVTGDFGQRNPLSENVNRYLILDLGVYCKRTDTHGQEASDEQEHLRNPPRPSKRLAHSRARKALSPPSMARTTFT